MTKNKAHDALTRALVGAMNQDFALLIVIVDRSGAATTHRITPDDCEGCSDRQKSGLRRALAAELGDLA